jgi:methylmalonyl-CoA/ethylmalonyl-CoA epimerase
VQWDPLLVTYRGNPSSAKLRVALFQSGDVQIELVAMEDGLGPASEHIQKYGEGLQHVRFTVEDIEASKARMELAGFLVVLDGATAAGIRFAYLEFPEKLGYTMIELFCPKSGSDHLG